MNNKDESIEHIKESIEEILSRKKNRPEFGCNLIEKELDHEKICNLIRKFIEKLDSNSSEIKFEVDEEKSLTKEALENKEMYINISGNINDDSFCDLMADMHGYDREEFRKAIRKPVEKIVINLEIDKDGSSEFK